VEKTKKPIQEKICQKRSRYKKAQKGEASEKLAFAPVFMLIVWSVFLRHGVYPFWVGVFIQESMVSAIRINVRLPPSG
jgi:hypothetical protein